MRLEHGRLHRSLIMAHLKRLSCRFRHEPWFEHCIFSTNLNCYNQIPSIILATFNLDGYFLKVSGNQGNLCAAKLPPAQPGPLKNTSPGNPKNLGREQTGAFADQLMRVIS